MSVTFKKLHSVVGAEVSPIDLRTVNDTVTLEQLRAGMDEHGVLVFRQQPFTDPEQLAFMQHAHIARRVLEIGTGCGYQAAVLSRVAKEVYSIERLRGLHERAVDNLRHLRQPNLHLILGDGMLGYAQGAPYAGIIAAAGGEALPQAWLDQLAVGGRLVAPVVSSQGQQSLIVIERTEQGFEQQTLELVHFVPLKSGIA